MKLRYRSSLLTIIFLAVGLTLAGCSSSPGTDTNNNTDDPPTNGGGGGGASGEQVEMTGTSFSPQNIEVEVGTTVTWVNNSSLVHTVTSGTNGESDGTFNSGNVEPDEEFSYTFNEVGEFDYFCIPHVNSGMVGKVTVVDSGDGN